jgi:hypothetical protein
MFSIQQYESIVHFLFPITSEYQMFSLIQSPCIECQTNEYFDFVAIIFKYEPNFAKSVQSCSSDGCEATSDHSFNLLWLQLVKIEPLHLASGHTKKI